LRGGGKKLVQRNVAHLGMHKVIRRTFFRLLPGGWQACRISARFEDVPNEQMGT